MPTALGVRYRLSGRSKWKSRIRTWENRGGPRGLKITESQDRVIGVTAVLRDAE